MTSSQHDLSLSRQIRAVLTRGGVQGQRQTPDRQWPSLSHYERLCGCALGCVSRYKRGDTKSLRDDYLDRLAYFTGCFPAATEEERRWRLAIGERWLDSARLRNEYPEILDYAAVQMKQPEEQPKGSADDDDDYPFDLDAALAMVPQLMASQES